MTAELPAEPWLLGLIVLGILAVFVVLGLQAWNDRRS